MKVHRRLHSIQPLVPIQQEANPGNVLPSFLFTKYFSIIFPPTLLLKSSPFLQVSSPILLFIYTHFPSPPYVRTSSTHLPTQLLPP